MLSNTVVRTEGMRVLAERLGPVDSERFITLLRREPFDYTEWRQGLFKDVPLEKFLRDAMDYRNSSEEREGAAWSPSPCASPCA